MGVVVKDGDLGSLCRPYRPYSSTGAALRAAVTIRSSFETVSKTLGYDLPPLRGSGGGWLRGKGSSVSDRIRHLRFLPHSGPYGRTSVRPYKRVKDLSPHV